jgi:prepilin-type processing-associated H-X9-DG protein
MAGRTLRQARIERKRERRRNGFVVWEVLALLVVGLLLAGVVTEWREVLAKKSNAIRCLANGRLMMQAFALYAKDHGGLLPPNEDVVYPAHTWFGAVSGSNVEGTNPQLAGDAKINLLAPYARDLKIWKCPADRSWTSIGGKRVPKVRSVAMNLAVGTVCNLFPAGHSGAPHLRTHGSWLDGAYGHRRDTRFRTFGKESEFVRPAGTFVFMEEHPASLNDGVFGTPGYDPARPTLSTVRWVDYPSVHHGNAAGVTFGDGHAEIHRWRGLKYPATGLPMSQVTAVQRVDWEWLGRHATQALP